MSRLRLVPMLVVAALLTVGPLPVGAAPGAGRLATDAAATSATTWKPNTVECQFLGLINAYRKQQGLGSLTISRTLGAAAEHHSVDMATNDYFSHTLSDGSSWADNIAAHRYPSQTARAENIAAGNDGAQATFDQWRNSAGHNANMLSDKYNAIGIGRAYNSAAEWKYYWTTTFGSVVDEAVSCPSGGGSGAPSGTQLRIVGGGRTSASTVSTNAYDADAETSWYTTKSTTPRYAYVYFDLGKVKSISAIKWLFARNGAADSFEVQVSSDKQTWTTVTKRTTAKAGSWQSVKVGSRARYVRFYFKNPNGDRVLGYLSEVRVFA